MNIFTSLKRGLASLSATSVLVAAFGAFAPVASADELSFVNSLPDTFNITTQDTIEFEVNKTEPNVPKNVTFFIRPEGGNAVNMDNFEFGEFTTFTFSWDGTLNGQDVAPGLYRAEFSGLDITTISHEFMVVNAEPQIDLNPKPAETYVKSQIKYPLSVDLSDFANDTEVTLYWVEPDNQLQVPQETFTYTGNGNHVFMFDVSDKAIGTQKLVVKGVDSEGNPTNEIAYEFELTNQVIIIPTPKISYVTDPKSSYTPGVQTLQVKLENFSSDTEVILALENPENQLFIPEETKVFTANGTKQFAFDLSDYAVGTGYKAQITGTYGDNKATNTLDFTFDVVAAVDTTCAGYLDIDASDANCDAIKWLKDQGIITGQGNGDYFDAAGILNRAEVSKIALEAHNKFNGNNGQCGTFPDVQAGQWFAPYVCEGVAIGMITGYKAPDPNAGKFLPANDVSVVEMFTLLLRPLDKNFVDGESYPSLKAGEWYSKYANFSKNNDLYTGNDVTVTQKATRLEVGLFIYNMHKAGLI